MKIFFFLLTFLISYTSAAQWVEIQSDTIGGIGGVDLNSIYFLNADTGYVEGRYRQNDEWVNSYFSTLDGGVSWNITTIEGGDGNIGFVNDTIGFVGGYPVQKTIDGGLNWTAYDSIPTGDKIQFVNDSIGYISSASNLYRTNDAGSSWVQIESIPAIFSAYDMHFINANTGYLVGINGYQLKGLISKTTDGGVNWSQQIVGNHPIRGIFFTDINTGYAVGGGSITVPHGQDWESVIFKTTDGGVNWTEQYSNTPEELQAVVFTDSDTGYAVGGLFGTILKTTNGGANWTHQNSPTFSYLNSVCFINSEIGYIAGRAGCILKTINGGNQINVIQNVNDGKASVYPNPAHHKIMIEFDNPKHYLFELTILNDLGIKVLVHRSITGDLIEVDINNFKTGIYFYILKSDQLNNRLSGKFIKN